MKLCFLNKSSFVDVCNQRDLIEIYKEFMRNDIVFMQTNEIPPRYERVFKIVFPRLFKFSDDIQEDFDEFIRKRIGGNSYAVISE